MKNAIATIFAILSGFAFAVLCIVVGDKQGLDPLVSAFIYAAPVLVLYTIACIRNGVEFTVIWASILAGTVIGMVAAMDSADAAGFVLIILVPLFCVAIIIHALLYKPELGFFGKAIGAIKAWRPGGIMPTKESIVGKISRGGMFGNDVQMALLGLVIALQVFDIGLKLLI